MFSPLSPAPGILLSQHFAYRAAQEVLRRFPGEPLYVVESGVTPSGKIHLGNFIDMVLADSVLRALRGSGVEVVGYLAVDSMDPFRQAPSFAPESFKREAHMYVGQPFESIPDPWGCHGSYAEHFVKPVEESFPAYGVQLEVVWASRLHKSERYVKPLLEVLAQRERVVEVLNRVKRAAGHRRLYPEGWIPYRPRCAGCGRIDEVVHPLSVEGSRVRYRCSACGYDGVADAAKGEGKPPWRVDWPLRWLALNVHFEPLGKDHMASGSGYDTGCALARELFGREPPVPIFYDFVYWVEHEGGERRLEKFSKRKGAGLGIDEWLRYAPPEVLRFQILKREVTDIYREALSHWEFDLRQVPNYVEEFDKFEETVFTDGSEHLKQLYSLSLPGPLPQRKPVRIPYFQAVRVAAWMEGLEDGMRMLERQGKLKGLESWEAEDAGRRLMNARNWLEAVGYGAVLRSPDEAAKLLEGIDGRVLRAFREAVSLILGGSDPNEAVKRACEGQGIAGREGRLQVYRAFYLALLGEESGPPLRRLIARREVIEVLNKIREKLESY
ncbi:MAG: lysine--tRNA ligase [Thermofilaceae archaeon]